MSDFSGQDQNPFEQFFETDPGNPYNVYLNQLLLDFYNAQPEKMGYPGISIAVSLPNGFSASRFES